MGSVVGWLRGLLAVGLLAGFYVLAFVLVVVDLIFVVLTLWTAFTPGVHNSSWAVTVGGSIAAVFALLYGISAVSRVAEPPAGAVFVRRRDAPELWRLVESVAARQHTRPPTRIYLTPEINASVSEDPRMLGFVTGDRTMYIGVPLLLLLTPAQLQAVLCHEFGHYAGGHTRFGAITYRGAAALESTLYRLRVTAQAPQAYSGYAWLFALVIGGYARLYLRLSLAVRRRQELEADAHAAAIAGPTATAEALRTVHALDHAWAGFLEMFVRPVQRLGFVPEDLFGAFTTMVEDPLVGQRLAELREHPAPAVRSHRDSHPPLPRRLALIEARPAGETGDADGHAPLLADGTTTRDVQRKLLDQAHRAGTALPLAAWSALAAEAFPIELAGLLLEAASGAGVVAHPTLGTVLDLLSDGGQDDLAGRLAATSDPGQLAEALYALVGQVLVNAGLARWRFSWTVGYLLIRHQQSGPNLQQLVEAAARDPSAVPDLRRELTRLGLDVDAPVGLTLRTVSAAATRISGVRIAGRVPEFVAEEVERQRQVRTFTMVVLAIVFVPWLIVTVRSGPTDGYRPLGTQAYGRPAQPVQRLSGPGSWPPPPRPFSETVPPLPSTDLYRLLPSFGPRPPVGLPDLYDTVTVKRGDTLIKIACHHYTTVEKVQEANHMGSRTKLRVGQKLKVPVGLGIVDLGCR